MSSITVPSPSDLPAAGSRPGRPRIFGDRPFGTDGDLLAVIFGPDGRLRSLEEPGVLRHWGDHGEQMAWHGLEGTGTVWCFDSEARLLASGSDELVLWDVASGCQLDSLPQSSWVTAPAFAPRPRLLATGHDDGRVRLWDLTGRRLLREFRAHRRPVSALAFRADGTRLASAGEDKLLRLWDVDSGEPSGTLTGHTDRISALAWHPDGVRLFSAGWDTTARVWDVRSCEPIILLNSHAAQVTALALSRDGRLLACADSARSIYVWDTESYRTLHVLRGHEDEVRSLAFSPDGTLASAGADRVIHLWDARQGRRKSGGDAGLTRVSAAISPDGSRLASTGGAALRIWDTDSGRLTTGRVADGSWQAVAWSPDGRWFAVAGDGPHIELCDAATGTARFRLDGLLPPVTSLTFSPDSGTLAAASTAGADVWVWHTTTGEPALLIADAANGGAVQAIAFHPEGRLLAAAGIDWLATGGSDGSVLLWDVPSRRQAAALPGGAVAVAFHPAGHRVATATLRQAVRVWGITSGQLVHEITGHADAVTCLAYSPDGRLLATGGDDRTVRLWDGTTGAPLGHAVLHTQVKALTFSPDGTLLYTGNGNASCTELELDSLLGRV